MKRSAKELELCVDLYSASKIFFCEPLVQVSTVCVLSDSHTGYGNQLPGLSEDEVSCYYNSSVVVGTT